MYMVRLYNRQAVIFEMIDVDYGDNSSLVMVIKNCINTNFSKVFKVPVLS